MDTEKWDRVTELFERALEMAPEQRERYLDQACGDDVELRHEVDSLLVGYDVEATLAEGAHSSRKATQGR